MNNSIFIVEKKLLTSDGDRFVNCIVDFFFIIIVMFLFTLFIIIIGNIYQLDVFRIWKEIIAKFSFLVIYLSFAMIYYLVFEAFFGRTIGKFITGSIVVNENGLKPNFKVVCIRTLCRLIPFDAFSFLGKSERIWHDSISKTYVVEKKALTESIKFFNGIELIGIKDSDF